MYLQDVYCAYCAQHFLNASMLIWYEIRDSDGVILERKPFTERGYQAIATVGKNMKAAEKEGNRYILDFYDMRSDDMIFAVNPDRGNGRMSNAYLRRYGMVV